MKDTNRGLGFRAGPYRYEFLPDHVVAYLWRRESLRELDPGRSNRFPALAGEGRRGRARFFRPAFVFGENGRVEKVN